MTRKQLIRAFWEGMPDAPQRGTKDTEGWSCYEIGVLELYRMLTIEFIENEHTIFDVVMLAQAVGFLKGCRELFPEREWFSKIMNYWYYWMLCVKEYPVLRSNDRVSNPRKRKKRGGQRNERAVKVSDLLQSAYIEWVGARRCEKEIEKRNPEARALPVLPGIMRDDYYADMEKAFARKQASASDQYIENTYMAYSEWDALEVK